MQSTAVLVKLEALWRDSNISVSSKLQLPRALAMLIVLDARVTWTVTAEPPRKIQALEMRSFRRVFGISYTEHVRNEEVCATITKHMKHNEEILTTAKKRKRRRYGHVT